MKLSPHRLPSRLAAAACVLSFFSTAQAQQTPAPTTPALPAPAAVEPVTPPAPPPPDPKWIKQLEQILTHKFTRELTEIFRIIEKNGTSDASTMTVTERFTAEFRVGDWKKIREELAQMPPEFARKIFGKMLADLTEKSKPNMRLDDVLGLADAVPGEFTGDDLRKVGQLLGLSVPANETYWLSDRLRKGTGKLGGADAAKRLLAGRVLIAGGFKDLARTFLPPLAQVEKITDEGVRNELTAFLTSQRESEAAQREQVQKVWDDNLRILTISKLSEWEKEKAGVALARVITQIPQTSLAPIFTDMVKKDPDTAIRLVSGLGRKLEREIRGDVTVRTDNLKTQAAIVNLLAENVNLGTQPWIQLAQMMAEFWITEAENTFTLRTTAPDKGKYVLPEELLPTAPSGKWAAVLAPGVRERLDAGVSKIILAGANFDQAADRIAEIGKRNPEAGVALAEDFLSVWAKTHNPQIPEALRKKYSLGDDARIPVTPIMMEKNIESLARMMDLFRQAGIAPKDYFKVVAAFDLAYSNAEAYRASHIESVFGPLEKMDEQLFLLILARMNANLSERWRKMDVQKAGLTHRDESATLEMVRAGYAGALHMIDGWVAGHPDGSHALTLGGSLLMDWGDFEYFQELVSGDARKRMLGYKEKNLKAQDYFLRGTAAYAKQVGKLAPADYSIEPYVAWFHGLLGIGSGGQINLSKAMNRAALTKIREQMLALQGKAGKAHIGMFAKIVNARLADENNPLHEDLKYRYLASALVITKDDPFTLGAEKKVAYFDELLSEIRLQTRVDGPNTVGRDQEFGIIVSIIHTEAMGRVAQFGQYVSNDPGTVPGAGAGKGRKKMASPLAKKMREAQSPRDELELSLTEALSPFFEIKSFTFTTPDVKPRPSAKPGWEETVLAYLLVHAKDASVDKIPPVGMELKFMDLTGPVTIPAESAETVIKVAAAAPARPAQKIEITQVLDTRQFQINGALALEITATASGLVPELDQLLDLDAMKKVVAIRSISPHEGLQVKELNTWGDAVAPRTERIWTLALDGDPIRAADTPTLVPLPSAKSKDVTVVSKTYKDMDKITLDQPSVKIGRTQTIATMIAKAAPGIPPWQLAAGGAGVLLVIILIIVAATRGRSTKQRALRARDVFKMPGEVDGFAVIALLRRMGTSPLVNLREPQQKELQQDLQRVQTACFGAKGGTMSETELRGLVEKWLRAAC